MEPKGAMVDPTRVILGDPWRGRGGVNHLSLSKSVKIFVFFFVTVFFGALLRQPALDTRPRAGGLFVVYITDSITY